MVLDWIMWRNGLRKVGDIIVLEDRMEKDFVRGRLEGKKLCQE